MKKYLVVIEKTSKGYKAFCPDLPGCVSTAKTESGLMRAMTKAVRTYLEALVQSGGRLPTPKTSCTYLEVSGG